MLATIVAGAVAATPAGAAFPGENGKISFVSDRAGNPDIWTMRPDGRGLVNLTRHPALDLGPEWQPLPNDHD
jgi:hypothetical protein